MTKLSTPLLKFFKHLNKDVTLFAYLLLHLATRVPVMSPQSWGTVGHLARPSTECSW